MSTMVGSEHLRRANELRLRLEQISNQADDTPDLSSRVVALTGPSGIGKSRIVRDFYSQLQDRQKGEPAYWPPLPEDDTSEAQLTGETFPLRKRLGPPPSNFVWKADSLPEFTWWTVNCETGSTGDALDTLAATEAEFSLHLKAAAIAKARRIALPERISGQRDQIISRMRDVGEEAVLEGLGQLAKVLTGSAWPGLSLIVDWIELGAKAIRDQVSDANMLRTNVRFKDFADDIRQSRADVLATLIASTATRSTPAVIAVEDAHLMNEAVAAFIKRAAFRVPAEPVMIVLTGHQPTEVNTPYAALLRQLRSNLSTWLIADLSSQDLVSLLERRAPKTPRRQAEKIVARYNNPFSLALLLGMREVKRNIRENDGAFIVDDHQLHALPRAVREQIRQRLTELPGPVVRALTSAGAALPEGFALTPFSGEILAEAMTELYPEEGTLLPALSSARDLRYLSLTSGWYSVNEELIADVLTSQVDTMERASVKGAVVDILRERIDAYPRQWAELHLPELDARRECNWLVQLLAGSAEDPIDFVAICTVSSWLGEQGRFREAVETLVTFDWAEWRSQSGLEAIRWRFGRG